MVTRVRLPVVGGLVKVLSNPTATTVVAQIANLQQATTALNAAVQTLQTPVVTPGSFSQPPTGTVKAWPTKGVSPAFMAADAAPAADPSILVHRGRRGDEGESGPRGYSGIPGYAGAAGAAGLPGVMGRRGDAGDTGRSGYTGATGPSGYQGVPGVAVVRQGEPGDVGRTGVPGPQGLAGSAGPPGAMGPLGGAAGRRMDHDQVQEKAPRGSLIRSTAATASLGLTAILGHSGNFMDAASAPALSVAIAPTMTGQWTFTPSASTSGPVFNTFSTNTYSATMQGSTAGSVPAVIAFNANNQQGGLIGFAGSAGQLVGDAGSLDAVILGAQAIRLSAGGHTTSGLVLQTNQSVTMPFYGVGLATFDASGNITSVPAASTGGPRGSRGQDGEDGRTGLPGIAGPVGATGAPGSGGGGGSLGRRPYHDEPHMAARDRVFDPRNMDGPVTINGSGAGTIPTLRVFESVGADGLIVYAASGSATDRCLNFVLPGFYNLFNMYNDGHGIMGYNGTGATLSWSAAGNVTIAAPSSGVAITVTAAAGGSAFEFADGGGIAVGDFNSTAAGGGYWTFSRSGAVKCYFGDASELVGGVIDSYAIRSGGAFSVATGGATPRLIIASGGAISLAGQTLSTGTSVPTIGTNKPGSAVSLTPQTWLNIVINGTTYYLPLWI